MERRYEILRNQHISQNYFKITLPVTHSPLPIPGQFYQVRCSVGTDPLLRRPFSVHRLLQKGSSHLMEILYRVAGKGTEWLSKREKGGSLDILGPFGNGFLIQEGMDPIVLVSRGIGIAPLYAVGEEALKGKKGRKIIILMGTRLRERIFYEEECKKIGEVYLYTDDGSRGFHGRAPDLLCHLLERKRLPERFSLFACGPAQMLKELADLSERFGFEGQVAMEDRMGCGFGACLSCACPLKPEKITTNFQWKKPALQWSEEGDQVYSLICKDGPVYDVKEVDWNEWIA